MEIPNEVLFNLLFDGDLYSCRPIPQEVGDYLKQQDPESKLFHLVQTSKGSIGPKYYELWTPEGWHNECRRKAWLESIGYEKSYSRPKHTQSETPIEQPKPKPISEYKKSDVEKNLREAAMKGDMVEATKWRLELLKFL